MTISFTTHKTSSENQCIYAYIIQKCGKICKTWFLWYQGLYLKIDPRTLQVKKHILIYMLYCMKKDHVEQHGFNAAINKLIRVCGAEISSKECQIMTVWFVTHLGGYFSLRQSDYIIHCCFEPVLQSWFF
jgi:hypothetical protein